MDLRDSDRRDILALCCHVARADGEVSPSEFERLLELLARLGGSAVGFTELQRWLEQGPPACSERLPEEHLRLFLHEALAVAHADGKVDESELALIKRILGRCFQVR